MYSCSKAHLPVSTLRLNFCPPIVTFVRYSKSESDPSRTTVSLGDDRVEDVFLLRSAARASRLDFLRGAFAPNGTVTSAWGRGASESARGARARTCRTNLKLEFSAFAAPACAPRSERGERIGMMFRAMMMDNEERVQRQMRLCFIQSWRN